jgi:predicted DNA-binding transcriptional regulator YafY
VADVDEEVQILIPRGALQFIELHNEIVETSQLLGDQLHLTLSISNTTWLLRTLSAINGSVSILSPENLSRDFELLNQRVLSNYGQI